ncbi:hypothetical protein LK994_06030 [Ferruginibacter lapsinanis]|uniref:hypothetical protein n=1 Tax=Ferruginibacter lapsinanis TaxID=563172 RepID=UPI001E4627F1|nr:hypothetical protein [Ferruginibacter lapsinanis]UEG51032.1 hypothetical protein LK994_06030 [Ferruginibacter lapsinanis]
MNKAKPKSCCKGRCYLKKKLDKSDKEDTPANNSNNKDRNEVLFFAEIKNIHNYTRTTTISKQKYSVHQNSDIPQNIVGSIFHPPQV